MKMLYLNFSAILALFMVMQCQGILVPGEPLKSPSEVIEEIKKLNKKMFHKDCSLSLVNEPVEYMNDTRAVKKLLDEALFAYVICDVYMRDAQLDKSDTKRFISKFQDWGRDPLRSHNFESKGNNRTEYLNSLAQEENRILLDCQRADYFKKELLGHIRNLECTYMYRKSHKPEAQKRAQWRAEDVAERAQNEQKNREAAAMLVGNALRKSGITSVDF